MEQENQSFVTEFVFIGLSSEPRVQTCLFAVFLVFYLLSVVGNILILAVIRADPRLHMPMYFFLSHLSFLDICYITTNVPQLLVNLSTKSRTISFRACATQMYFSLACGMNECFLLGVMAYDRYVAICHPLRYTVIMNRKLCTQMVAVCWSCSLLSCLVVSALTLRLPFCGPNTLNHYFCEVPAMLALACADTSLTEKVVFIFSILIVFLPFILIVLSYGRILSAIVWMKYDSSRAKAFSTCGSHLAVVALFYGTATIMYTRPQVKSSQDRNKIIALFYTIITPMLNPMIYSLRNKDVKGALKRAVGG